MSRTRPSRNLAPAVLTAAFVSGGALVVASLLGLGPSQGVGGAKPKPGDSNRLGVGSGSGEASKHVGSARDFLAKRAEAGDEAARRAVEERERARAVAAAGDVDTGERAVAEAVRELAVKADRGFRMDVTRSGLVGSLEAMMRLKKAEEAELVKEANKTGKWDESKREFERVRREKQEIARLIDRLRPKSWKEWAAAIVWGH